MKMYSGKKMMTIGVGTFEVVDEMITVGDPCYDRNGVEMLKAKNGTYHVFVKMSDEGKWGVRVAELLAIHEDANFGNNDLEWDPCDFSLPVDSGTMGIYDNEYHYDHHYNGLDEKWYDKNVCDGLDKNCRFHIVDNRCVISESGLGDGCYDVNVVFDDLDTETICAVRIIFIDEDDE